MTPIEPCGLDGGDKELRAVGVAASIRHRKVSEQFSLWTDEFWSVIER